MRPDGRGEHGRIREESRARWRHCSLSRYVADCHPPAEVFQETEVAGDVEEPEVEAQAPVVAELPSQAGSHVQVREQILGECEGQPAHCPPVGSRGTPEKVALVNRPVVENTPTFEGMVTPTLMKFPSRATGFRLTPVNAR